MNGHQAVQRTVAVTIGIVLGVLISVALLSYVSMRRLARTPDSVQHSYQVLRALDRVTTRLAAAESDTRGYVITLDPRHLARFGADTLAVAEVIAELRQLTADDPLQRQRVAALEPVVRARLGALHAVVTRRGQDEEFDSTAARVGRGVSAGAADSVGTLSALIEARALARLRERVGAQRSEMERVTSALVAGCIVAVLLSALIIVAVRRDTAGHAAVEDALIKAKEAAELASRSKSDFLARMSHELRTPLNSVIGFSNVLLKNRSGNLGEQDLSYLTRIAANGRHLLALINDVLDLSKVEAGHLQIDSVPVRLDVLVADTIAELEAQPRDRDVRLIAMMPPAMAVIHTDPVRLRQVLVNLIANALKFTERGSVAVRVDVDRLTREPTRIAVIDTGIGIPADRQQRIFEAFEQVSGGSTRRYGGTGLGLTIARSLCELLGFHLELSSQESVGSVFSVVLSSADTDTHHAVADGTRRASPARVARAAGGGQLGQVSDPARRLVLIVDDEADARLLLSQYVEDFGCQALAVGSAQQGLAAAREFRPDVIVLDLLIPHVSGWDMLRELQAEPGIRDIPVIIVSVVGGEDHTATLGAMDTLAKPVSREDLNEALRRNLGRVLGRVLVIDDDPDAQRMMATHLREAEELEVLSASDGREALMVLDSVRPDLIVLSLGPGRMDGLVFLAGLRRDRRYLHVPVVVVTTDPVPLHEMERLRSEVYAVVGRDQLPQGELQRLLRALRQPRQVRPARAPQPVTTGVS